MCLSLIEQYEICLERGHDTSHSFGMGQLISYRCKYCGTMFHDETIRHETRHREEVHAYLKGKKRKEEENINREN